MTGYKEFGSYLDEQNESFSIKFDDVEEIIGEKLPPSAYDHQPWWSNSDTHPLMKIVLSKNWKSKNLNLDTQEIEFYKFIESEKFYFVEKDFEYSSSNNTKNLSVSDLRKFINNELNK